MKQKKVMTMTFHAAHNYGSCLQAYALQKFLQQMEYDTKIIDFRSDAQIEMYKPLTKRRGVKYFFKNLFYLLNYKKRKEKYKKFETFIDNQYVLTERYSSLEELEQNPPEADCYISGSDQIWNTGIYDACMAYFLSFVKTGQKVAYAPSFGPIGIIKKEEQVQKLLSEYDCLSVREENGQKQIKRLTGIDAPILVDPTLLLSKQEWESFVGQRIVEHPYLFFYTLFADKGMIKLVKTLAKQLGLKVVVSNISNQYDVFAGFEKRLDAGPEDFLNLIYHADFVCTSSFHGTVFSIVFNKQFVAINGEKDKRISTLLEKFNLQERSLATGDEIHVDREYLLNCSFTDTEAIRQRESKVSEEYLVKGLE